ncbi:MAG: NAD-dependent epimerase/dehydratase family protein, partial [Bacteroidia bacterium]
MMKKILVTGGAGFIGSAVIKHFQKFDYEIFVLDNLSFGNRQFINVPDDHFYDMDILDRQKVSTVITKIKPDIILHLAAIHFIPYCNQHPYESSNINIQGTMNVLDAAEKSKPEKILFAST